MSKMLLYPNFCSCTVHQARNLPEKGKNGGVDGFCTISMGKDKFVTAVKEKTRSPEWQEQCDMPIVDDATIKLTVYHNNKNALSKGDFIGRAYISLRDLQDYDHVHRNWLKLLNKDGKADKERGEIDVSLQFYSKNNTTGSVLDLATKKKHLSLKDIKHSLGSKLKSASKHRKDEKYAGDNQTASFAGSHMSLNSMSLNNNAESQSKKSMSLNRREGDRMSSIRSSVKRKIQPKVDLMQQSFSELDSPANPKFGNAFASTRFNGNPSTTLPDIVGEQTVKNSSSSSNSNAKKTNDQSLSVLGYDNVKIVSVQPKVREELDYLDREELLQVIAFQSDLLKKRDSRLKDLENYTDTLLVKILEQCPTILQNGILKHNNK